MSAGCGRALGRVLGEGPRPSQGPGVAVPDRRRGGRPRGAGSGSLGSVSGAARAGRAGPAVPASRSRDPTFLVREESACWPVSPRTEAL